MNYFSLNEFKSPDTDFFPTEVVYNLGLLIQQLNILRGYINEPIYVSSGYRTNEHNEKVGGVVNSYHIQGKAADIYTLKYTAIQLYEIVRMLTNDGLLDIGYCQVYPDRNFIHIDIGRKRFW